MKFSLLFSILLFSFVLSSYSQEVKVSKCKIDIPADAQVVKVSGIFKETKNYWVCTHSVLQFKGNGASIFVEPFGQLIVVGDSNTIYLKARAKFSIQGKGNTIVHQNWKGAKTDSLNHVSECSFVFYNYKNAPKEGCPEFTEKDYRRRTFYIVAGSQTVIMDTLTIPNRGENVVKDSIKSIDVDTVSLVQNIKAEPKFEDLKEEELAVGEKLFLNNVLFDRGKYVLSSSSFPELDKLADLMKRTPKMKVQLEGHTDITGSDKQNMQLSKHRVLVVKHYLVEKGIDGSRIATQAFGSSKPIVENLDEKNRSLNRRVEMKILEL